MVFDAVVMMVAEIRRRPMVLVCFVVTGLLTMLLWRMLPRWPWMRVSHSASVESVDMRKFVTSFVFLLSGRR